jgi:UDP-N-acetylglucosamine--N-acetylmuramyl-(pentapeptide) pyrophosphoryl-undecaprenol N-acetylglucosamine transferase
MIKKKILIATGGTGGHVFPAYSLANYLTNKNFSVKLTVDERGRNYLKDYNDLDLINIPSSPLIKNNIFKLLLSILTNLFSLLKSLLFLFNNKPLIVFGMGGYSSFPICIAASILRIKFIIYENNLIIGKANRYLLPFAKKIFVSNKSLEGIPIKFEDKVIEIGNLIREEIINTNISDQKDEFKKINILVLGGSQAAKIFADELPEIFEKLKKSKIPIKVFQQCQEKQNDQLSKFYTKAGIEYEVFNFTKEILKYYSKANLVITRSGASVLGELINVKIPFISIPLPTSADNHQYKNAEFYSKKGYGYLLEEKNIKSKLFELINTIFRDKSLIEKILFNQRQHSDKDIFKKLNNEIEQILNEKN